MEPIRLLTRITTDCESDHVDLNTKKNLEQLLKILYPYVQTEAILEYQEYMKGGCKWIYANLYANVNGEVWTVYNKWHVGYN